MIFFCFLIGVLDFFLQLVLRKLSFGIANPGISFGINFGNWQMTLVIVFVVIVMILKRRSDLGWWLMLVGAFSNLINRLVYGSVWDYFRVWSLVFNLADMMIVSGMMLLFWKTLKTDGNTLAR